MFDRWLAAVLIRNQTGGAAFRKLQTGFLYILFLIWRLLVVLILTSWCNKFLNNCKCSQLGKGNNERAVFVCFGSEEKQGSIVWKRIIKAMSNITNFNQIYTWKNGSQIAWNIILDFFLRILRVSSELFNHVCDYLPLLTWDKMW